MGYVEGGKHGDATMSPSQDGGFPDFMMKKRLLLSLLSSACLSQAEEPAKASIWKLSDEDSTVYLAGSVHLLRESDLPIPAAFDQVYAEVEEVVFEIDMAKAGDPQSAMAMRRAGTLPAGESIDDHLPAELTERLRDYLAKASLPRTTFDRFKPGFAFLSLASIEAMRKEARADLGLESTFFQKAKADGKPSRGLETMEYQLARFDELAPETMAELIESTLNDAEDGEDPLDEIISAWKTGDGEGLASLIIDEMEEEPEVLEVLLVERNRNWIPAIEEALATDRDVMFLVGAAHLVGDDSVIDLLEKKGFSPVQMDAAP